MSKRSRPDAPLLAQDGSLKRAELSDIADGLRRQWEQTRASNQALIEELRQELARHQHENESLRKERLQLIGSLADLQARHESQLGAEQHQQTLEQERDNLRQKIDTVQQENKALKLQLETVVTALRELTTRQDEAQEEVLLLEEQIYQLQSIIGLLELQEKLHR